MSTGRPRPDHPEQDRPKIVVEYAVVDGFEGIDDSVDHDAEQERLAAPADKQQGEGEARRCPNEARLGETGLNRGRRSNGTATTPLITAAQNSALIGSRSVKWMKTPTSVGDGDRPIERLRIVRQPAQPGRPAERLADA